MKIRNGFVSNSSSSSFIVICNDESTLEKCTYLQGLVIDQYLGETQFGWQYEKYLDTGSKINFAYIQAMLSSENVTQKYLDMLDKVIKEYTNAPYIEIKISTDWNSNERYAYIDHASSSGEGQNLAMFENETHLRNFLFNSKSYIQNDNDNRDIEEEKRSINENTKWICFE